MDPYERLTEELTHEGLRVNESILRGKAVHGLYVDTPEIPPTALVNGDLTGPEKRCVLAEEAGHHYRSGGDILDQSTPAARKSENAGRRWAWEKLLPLEAIALKKLENPDLDLAGLAEALEVTPTFLLDAAAHYARISGPRKALPCGMTVQFHPYFDVWPTGESHEEYLFYTRAGRGLDAAHRSRLHLMARRLFRHWKDDEAKDQPPIPFET